MALPSLTFPTSSRETPPFPSACSGPGRSHAPMSHQRFPPCRATPRCLPPTHAAQARSPRPSHDAKERDRRARAALAGCARLWRAARAPAGRARARGGPAWASGAGHSPGVRLDRRRGPALPPLGADSRAPVAGFPPTSGRRRGGAGAAQPPRRLSRHAAGGSAVAQRTDVARDAGRCDRRGASGDPHRARSRSSRARCPDYDRIRQWGAGAWPINPWRRRRWSAPGVAPVSDGEGAARQTEIGKGLDGLSQTSRRR